MVEVFKTNVRQRDRAQQLTSTLYHRFPLLKVDFDLEDCDKILRIEGSHIYSKLIIELISANWAECEVLPD